MSVNVQVGVSREQLAKQLMPLVHEVASQVARRVPDHVAKDDLIGAGMLGLAGALARFDPDRAETFRGYAEFRIRGAILDDLRAGDLMSREARTELKRLERTIDDLTSELGRRPNDDEVADKLEVPLARYNKLQLRLRNSRTVPAEGMSLADRGPNASELIDGREMKRRVMEGIESLPERPRRVLSLYYFHDVRMHEIGSMLGISTSRVCQIRREAVARLRLRVHSPVTMVAKRQKALQAKATIAVHTAPAGLAAA